VRALFDRVANRRRSLTIAGSVSGVVSGSPGGYGGKDTRRRRDTFTSAPGRAGK